MDNKNYIFSGFSRIKNCGKKRYSISCQILLIFFLSFGLTACRNDNNQEKQEPVYVNFSHQANTGNLSNTPAKDSILEVAISAIISPAETFIYYKDILNYISKKINIQVVYKQKKTYAEINDLIVQNKIKLAFICSGSYVLMNKNEAEILVVPVSQGKPYYQAYVIANTNSKIENFSDFRGKSFAYSDPISNTGHTYIVKRLKNMGLTDKQYFSKTIYTYAHDISIQMVAKNLVDGATVDGLIFEYLKKNEPEKVKSIRIIEKSELFGIPPIVVPANIDKKLKMKLKDVFLNLHKDSTGAELLKKIMVDKFIEAGDTLYNSLRNY